MSLSVKLAKAAKGSELISAFEKAAKDMTLETEVITVPEDVILRPSNAGVEKNILLLKPYFCGLLKNNVSALYGISPEKTYTEFELVEGIDLIGPKFEDVDWDKYLKLVSKYLDSRTKQPNN